MKTIEITLTLEMNEELKTLINEFSYDEAIEHLTRLMERKAAKKVKKYAAWIEDINSEQNKMLDSLLNE